MILKLAFGVIAILATVAGIIAIAGDPAVAAAFAFGGAVLSGISLAYLIGRDGKKSP
ncbi:hypothetical protein [Nesterenkonia sphaerica]|uniref:hypothetical protein n=1 Tax=Nesterenkonia sphaerica TaxID=1804988 RepID=UPI00140E0A31|nr:hypothetical protein [Nesterenkonia sphaerica]